MSAAVERKAGMVVLPPDAGHTGAEAVNASMTRWAWNPYRPINNMGPISLARAFGAGGAHRYAELNRCTFYPLKNITWDEVDLEQEAERHLSGLGNGPAPKKTFVKYAYDQAAELSESFGESHGLRILQPGIMPEGSEFRDTSWVDDYELVQLIAETIQPEPFKLSEIERELGDPARKRIARSVDLTEGGKALADEIRKVMLAGATLARREAEREHRHLVQEMGNAAVGKPGIATPNEFHEWLCEQLNVKLPARVDVGQSQPSQSLEAAVGLLLKKELEKTDESQPDKIEQMMARLEATERELAEVKGARGKRAAKKSEADAEEKAA